MIFKKKDVKKIVKILEDLDKEKQIKLAKENFEKIKEFSKDILEEKRKEFYK